MGKLSDEWQTPQGLFDALNKGGLYQGIKFEGFNFDVDLCATEYNSKCAVFSKDYLNDVGELIHERAESFYLREGFKYWNACFMNPPYSNPKPFLQKAWEDSKHCKIVCLLKVDPSTRWWATFWNYNKGRPKLGCKVIFFPKRIKFEPPADTETKATSANFASCLVIMDRRG